MHFLGALMDGLCHAKQFVQRQFALWGFVRSSCSVFRYSSARRELLPSVVYKRIGSAEFQRFSKEFLQFGQVPLSPASQSRSLAMAFRVCALAHRNAMCLPTKLCRKL